MWAAGLRRPQWVLQREKILEILFLNKSGAGAKKTINLRRFGKPSDRGRRSFKKF